MEIETFDDDLLELEEFAEKLEGFVRVEQRFVPESLVISLNAGFGAGKSTFLKMWVDRIKKKIKPEDAPLVVQVNAWNDDYCGDPFLSLVSALVEALNSEDQCTHKLINAAKDVGWFITGIGGQIINKFTGIDAVSAGELAEKKRSSRQQPQEVPNGLFDIFRMKKNALQLLKSSIKEILEGVNPNILIIVDELDRCRPDYAISYLETIKHVFDIRGIVFVIAADRKQLECSAKTSFGADLNFSEYYRKFVQREVTLPKPNKSAYGKLAKRYVEYYLNRENERYCIMSIDYHRVENIVELISYMKMTPRQVQEVFRIMGHVFETDESKKGKLSWCLGVGTILMASLRIGSPGFYKALGGQGLKIIDAANYFRKLSPEQADWWFTLCLTGNGLNSEDVKGKELAAIFREAGFASDEDGSQRRYDFDQWHSGWGHSTKNRFKQIYSTIEQVSSWS